MRLDALELIRWSLDAIETIVNATETDHADRITTNCEALERLRVDMNEDERRKLIKILDELLGSYPPLDEKKFQDVKRLCKGNRNSLEKAAEYLLEPGRRRMKVQKGAFAIVDRFYLRSKFFRHVTVSKHVGNLVEFGQDPRYNQLILDLVKNWTRLFPVEAKALYVVERHIPEEKDTSCGKLETKRQTEQVNIMMAKYHQIASRFHPFQEEWKALCMEIEELFRILIPFTELLEHPTHFPSNDHVEIDDFASSSDEEDSAVKADDIARHLELGSSTYGLTLSIKKNLSEMIEQQGNQALLETLEEKMSSLQSLHEVHIEEWRQIMQYCISIPHETKENSSIMFLTAFDEMTKTIQDFEKKFSLLGVHLSKRKRKSERVKSANFVDIFDIQQKKNKSSS